MKLRWQKVSLPADCHCHLLANPDKCSLYLQSEGSFPASPASPPDDARGFLPQPRLMPHTSFISGMEDPAFPSPASPAFSGGDDMLDVPAMLAGEDDMGMGQGAIPPRHMQPVSALFRRSPKLTPSKSRVGAKGGPPAPIPSNGWPAAPSGHPAGPTATAVNPTLQPSGTPAASPTATFADLESSPLPGLQDSAAAPSTSQPSSSSQQQHGHLEAKAGGAPPVRIRPTPAMPPLILQQFPVDSTSPMDKQDATAAASGLPDWMDLKTPTAHSNPDSSGFADGYGAPPSAEPMADFDGASPAGLEPASMQPMSACSPAFPNAGQGNAELAGAGSEDGYGDGMFSAPDELGHGLGGASGPESSRAAPEKSAPLQPEPISHPLQDFNDQLLPNGHPLDPGGHPLQQGDDDDVQQQDVPTPGISPRLSSPSAARDGLTRSPSDALTGILPPPPPRLGESRGEMHLAMGPSQKLQHSAVLCPLNLSCKPHQQCRVVSQVWQHAEPPGKALVLSPMHWSNKLICRVEAFYVCPTEGRFLL